MADNPITPDRAGIALAVILGASGNYLGATGDAGEHSHEEIAVTKTEIDARLQGLEKRIDRMVARQDNNTQYTDLRTEINSVRERVRIIERDYLQPRAGGTGLAVSQEITDE